MRFSFFFRASMIALFFFFACRTADTGILVGSWQAFEVLEEGEVLPVNTEEISFSFGEDASYQYSSTLNYREAGSYFVDTRYLFTTDTINNASSEKAVEIIKLNPDTLFLRMQEGNKERIMKLKKLSD